MAETTIYAVKCPNCGKENKITNVYFMADEGGYERCLYCGKRFYTNKPNSPFKKPGEAEAYEKNKAEAE